MMGVRHRVHGSLLAHSTYELRTKCWLHDTCFHIMALYIFIFIDCIFSDYHICFVFLWRVLHFVIINLPIYDIGKC